MEITNKIGLFINFGQTISQVYLLNNIKGTNRKRDSAMEKQMKIMVNMLKERIKHNLQIIKKNEEEIRIILSQPVSNNRSELLKDLFDTNRVLLEENHDSLAIELQMINYMIKFKSVLKQQPNRIQSSSFIDDSASSQIENEASEAQVETHNEQDILSLTISGDLPFNSSHPMFNDVDFFDNLLDAYKQSENYEMCSQILKVKGMR